MKNPQAFPRYNNDQWFDGMTLRDYFAGQWIANEYASYTEAKDIARRAYEVADAMLKQREEQ